jgi:hypothetical protein
MSKLLPLAAFSAKWFISFSPHLAFLEVSLGRSQWPRGLRRTSAAARLLRSYV